MPAYPTISAGAASCLSGWAPVAMGTAGGAPSRWLIPGPAPPRACPITATASPATGLAEPSGLRSKGPQAGTALSPGQGTPYLSQAWGTFQTQDSRSPAGQEGQAGVLGKNTPREWWEGLETCQERGPRLVTGQVSGWSLWGSMPTYSSSRWSPSQLWDSGHSTPLPRALVSSAAKWEAKKWL